MGFFVISPLALIQKYINFWYSSSVDLFGAEKSTNAAQYFAAGLKGRAHEEKRYEDHIAKEGVYEMDSFLNGAFSKEEVPLRLAMNEILRDAYIDDNQGGVDKWNKILENAEMDFRFSLPHRRFNRTVGMWSDFHFDPQGNLLSAEEWDKKKWDWLPTQADKVFVKSLMQQVKDPGKIAGWIAPPHRGIKGMPQDFEYVKL